MSTIVLRNVKGSPLTFNEMDANFSNLNNDKADKLSRGSVKTTWAGPYIMTPATPATGRYEFEAVSDGGWAAVAHTFKVEYEVVTSAYFTMAGATGAHCATVLHQDPALWATAVRGNGMIMGNCNNGAGEFSYVRPTTMAESWYNGTAATLENRLIPGSDGFEEFKPTDGVTYRVIVESTVDENDNRWVRYRIYAKNTSIQPEGAWDLQRDTGHLLDKNPWADFTKKGFGFGQVFADAGYPPWTITFTNITATWGPPTIDASAQRKFPTMIIDTSVGTNAPNYGFCMTGWDNPYINSFARDLPGWDWNTILDVNDIKNALVGFGMSSTNASAVEQLLRPLYCIVAKQLYHAKRRGEL